MPVSVERLDKDKDADENVDADHARTERPVESEQSIDLLTQREDIDIDFRVSGLPHQADVQQNSVVHFFIGHTQCVLHSWLAQLNKTGGGPSQTVLSQSKVRFVSH